MKTRGMFLSILAGFFGVTGSFLITKIISRALTNNPNKKSLWISQFNKLKKIIKIATISEVNPTENKKNIGVEAFKNASKIVQEKIEQKGGTTYSPVSILLALCGLLPALTKDNQDILLDSLNITDENKEAFFDYLGEFHTRYGEGSVKKAATFLLVKQREGLSLNEDIAKKMGIDAKFFRPPLDVAQINKYIEELTEIDLGGSKSPGIKNLLPNSVSDTDVLSVNTITDRKDWVAEVVKSMSFYDVDEEFKVQGVKFYDIDVQMCVCNEDILILFKGIIFGIGSKKTPASIPSNYMDLQWKTVKLKSLTIPKIEIPEARLDVVSLLPSSVDLGGPTEVKGESVFSAKLHEKGWEAKAATYFSMRATSAPPEVLEPSVIEIVIDTPFAIARLLLSPLPDAGQSENVTLGFKAVIGKLGQYLKLSDEKEL